MKVIITGGTGFIGRQVVNQLLNKNVQVTVLTSDVAVSDNRPLVTIVHTTYVYEELLQKLSGKTYDIFYHLGWAGVDGKQKNNIPLQLSNIQASIDMLKLSRALECELFVAAGTVAEYVFNENIIDFSMKQTPNDVYGATKTAVHY